MQKSTASITCVVVGNEVWLEVASFTMISVLLLATPLYTPFDAFPFPAAIPATCVPCPEISMLGHIEILSSMEAAFIARVNVSLSYTVPKESKKGAGPVLIV